MSDRFGNRPDDAQTQSDDELVQRVRDSDTTAYAELWLRHSAAAHAAARAFSSLDPDDLVAEAFARILAAIGRGGGPQMGFRPYLLTSVRNVASEWGGRQQRIDTTDLEDAEEAASPAAEHEALSALENGAAATAFRMLPTRWQEALWYSEVDGLKPRQFAPLLGLAPNAASALVVRARRGFRDAWIQTQLRAADSEECRAVIALLGAHTRRALSRRDSRMVDEHIDTCDGCAIAWAEARDVASRLALALLPIVVGIPATAAYASWVQSGGSQAVPVALAAGLGSVGAGSTARPIERVGRSSRVTLAGVSVVAAVVLGGVGAAALSTVLTTSELTPPTSEIVTSPTSNDATDSPSPSAAEASPAPTTSAAPDAPEDSVPVPYTPPVPATPPPEAVPTPAPTAAEPEPTTPPASGQPEEPGAPTTPAEPTDPEAPGQPTEPGEPEEPEEPGEPEEPEAPGAPTMAVDTSAGSLVYPLLSGDDAQPGAQIEIVDGSGIVRARTTADDAGIWQQNDLSDSECATVAAGYLPAGTHQLAARQIVDGQVSELGAAVPITVVAPPQIDALSDGDEVDADGFVLTVTGAAGASVQRIKVPDAAPCRPTPMTLDDEGRFSQEFTTPDRGEFTIGVRYIDTATGRHGPAMFVNLIAY